jgi:WD40 repeat protein
VCSTSDLKYAVTGSEDQTARLWVIQRDLKSASTLFVLEGHTGTVNAVAFSPDGKWIVTGSSDCTAKLWSCRAGECKRTFEGYKEALMAVSLSSDGVQLLTQGLDTHGAMIHKTWEVETGRCQFSEKLEGYKKSTFASARDGRIALRGDGSVGTVLEEAEEDKQAAESSSRRLEGHDDEVTAVDLIEVRVPVKSSSPPSSPLSRSRSASPSRRKKPLDSTLPPKSPSRKTLNTR